MEFQVQFPIRNLLIISILLIGCEHTIKEGYSVEVLSKSNLELEIRNGVIFKNGEKYTGALIDFYPNTIDTLVYMIYKDGLENGIWKKFYPGNQLAERRFFKDGIKSGVLQKWWPNGKPQLLYTFTSGEYNGEGLEWNETGFLTKRMNYKNGLEDGLQQWWYDNGKIKSNYIIKNGRRFGLLGTKNCVNVSDSIN